MPLPICDYDILSRTVSDSQLFVQILDTSRFWAPFGGLGTTYDNHLKLIGKRDVDFLLVLIELFSLDVTAEALRRNIGSKSAISLQQGPVDQISGRRGRPRQPFFSQKTRLNDLSYGIKIWTYFSSVLLQFTRLTDERTGGQTAFSWLDGPALNAARKKWNGCHKPVKTVPKIQIFQLWILLIFGEREGDSHTGEIEATSSLEYWLQ